MNRKIAVLISDIHFSINTLNLASQSLQAALRMAEELNVPLVVAGDLNDTKAIIRAEVANAIISILKDAKTKIYILEGNHDKINEKGIGHGLNYLEPYAEIIDKVKYIGYDVTLFPYYSDRDSLLRTLRAHFFRGKILIMHQGFLGAFMGDYIQDKTSIDVSEVKDYTVFSGHYHRHQTLGTVTYIGSPYTISYGEANDGPKGFISISDDGTFERHILNLRKHVIINMEVENISFIPDLNPNDLIWLKLTGKKSELEKISRLDITSRIIGHSNFKLEKIATEDDKVKTEDAKLTDTGLFDKMIEELSDTNEHKEALKQLWRELLDETT